MSAFSENYRNRFALKHQCYMEGNQFILKMNNEKIQVFREIA